MLMISSRIGLSGLTYVFPQGLMDSIKLELQNHIGLVHQRRFPNVEFKPSRFTNDELDKACLFLCYVTCICVHVEESQQKNTEENDDEEIMNGSGLVKSCSVGPRYRQLLGQ